MRFMVGYPPPKRCVHPYRVAQPRKRDEPVEIRLHRCTRAVDSSVCGRHEVHDAAESRLVARQRYVGGLLGGFHLHLGRADRARRGLQVVIRLPDLELRLLEQLVARRLGLGTLRLGLPHGVGIAEKPENREYAR